MTNDHGVSFCYECKRDYSWLFHDRGICFECEKKQEKEHDDKIRAEGYEQGRKEMLSVLKAWVEKHETGDVLCIEKWIAANEEKGAKGREKTPGCALANSGKPQAQTLSDQGQRGLTRSAKSKVMK